MLPFPHSSKDSTKGHHLWKIWWECVYIHTRQQTPFWDFKIFNSRRGHINEEHKRICCWEFPDLLPGSLFSCKFFIVFEWHAQVFVCIKSFIKKWLLFILHVVWELLTVTNENIINYDSDFLFSITFTNLNQKDCRLCLSNKWKCNKKSGVTVVHGIVATSPFDSWL